MRKEVKSKMRDYMINGTCVKKNGSRYPFRKRLTALNRKDARDQINQVFSAIEVKLYNKGKGLHISPAKPLKERPSKRKVQRKECRVCAPTRGPLPLSAFGKDKNSADGLMRTCRKCRSKEQKASRERIHKHVSLRLHSQLELTASELSKVEVARIERIKINDEVYVREKDISKVLSEMSSKFCSDLMNQIRSEK